MREIGLIPVRVRFRPAQLQRQPVSGELIIRSLESIEAGVDGFVRRRFRAKRQLTYFNRNMRAPCKTAGSREFFIPRGINRGFRAHVAHGVSVTNHQPNRARTCLYARRYQTPGITFKDSFSRCCGRDRAAHAQHQRLVVVLEVAGVEAFVRTWPGLPGRPLKDRHALAVRSSPRRFARPGDDCGVDRAAAVDRTLRRLCGWERAASVPGESTFSRAFAEICASGCRPRARGAD